MLLVSLLVVYWILISLGPFWKWHAVAILRLNTSGYERIIRILINARLIIIGRFVRVAYARSRPFVLWAQ